MEWWMIGLLLAVLALLLLGPVALVAFAYYGIRYRSGDDDCERPAGRWLKVFVFWAVPVIGMIILSMADNPIRQMFR